MAAEVGETLARRTAGSAALAAAAGAGAGAAPGSMRSRPGHMCDSRASRSRARPVSSRYLRSI